MLCFLAASGFLYGGSAEVGPTLEDALRAAGENRADLEAALRRAPGSDTEFLIRNASQYDLVNLTADHLVENVRLARAVRDAPFFEGGLSEAMWRKWVLPYRVLEEDLDRWRGRLHPELWPLVVDAGDSGEAAIRVLEWLWKVEDDGTGRVHFGTSETRNKSPGQVLAGGGACRELNLLYVACLRSVGIPARHGSVGWWYQKSNSHYFSQYWDSGSNEWKAWDASDNLGTNSEPPRERFERGRWKTLRAYAHPGVWRGRDLYGTNRWERFVPITGSMAGDTMSLAFAWPGVDEFEVALHVWNLRTWRRAVVASASPGDGVARFDLIRNRSLKEPVLAVVTDGDEMRARLVNLRERAGGTIEVNGEWKKEEPLVFEVGEGVAP